MNATTNTTSRETLTANSEVGDKVRFRTMDGAEVRGTVKSIVDCFALGGAYATVKTTKGATMRVFIQ